MAKINTLNYQTVAAWNGSQDLFVVEQPDGTKVATPAMVKQYVLGNSIDDIYSVMGQMGAKNLIPYPYVNTTQTINNVNFTDNGDGSISADNAASATTQFRLYGWTSGLSPLLLRKGTYILSGCPSGGGINSLRLYLHNQDSSFSAIDDGEGTQFTLSDDTYVGIAIRVANGYDADGKTIYPMLRLASDTDDTYQPYAKTNKQLTEVIGDLSQTGLTGDSVAAQLGSAKTYVDNAVATATAWTDISSRCTVDTTKVASFSAYTCGKIIYISLTLKVGVTDQSNVVTNLPQVVGYGVLPMFYMNVIDITSGGVCMYAGTTIQYRGNATQGANGTQYSGMFLLV